jgi:hypothetical protein
VHIEDVSRTFIAALEAPEDHVCNQAFNVVAQDAGPDKRSERVSFEKIARVLPTFKPQ